VGTEVSNQAVCNCGPLIALAGINQLALLPHLFRKVSIPAVVYQELTGSQRFAATRHLFNPSWLEVVTLPEPCDAVLASQLDPGEAAVLALACRLKDVEVLVDERKARRLAERLYGLRIVGTGGLLLRAKAAGLIPGVQPALASMKANGYHLSDRLVAAICRVAGEGPTSVS
jgi:predicted nucleic acid-binding protein